MRSRKNLLMRWRLLWILQALVGVAWISSVVTSEATVLDFALALGVLTVLAAILDWRVGLVAAVTAALSLNFFHAEPRYSLAISSSGDVSAVTILATGGIIVSLVFRAVVRRELASTRRMRADSKRHDLLEDLDTPIPVTSVWIEVVDSVDEVLEDLDIRLARDVDRSLPVLSRRVQIGIDSTETSSRVIIPPSGALAEFRDPRLGPGVVLLPRGSNGNISISRRTLTNFLDDLELIIGKD